MRADYGLLAVFLLAGVSLALLALALGPRARAAAGRDGSAAGEAAPAALEPFESGAPTANKTWVQFRVRYFLVALVFVAFDMEMVYMFPWAVVFKRIGFVAFMDMFVFIAILSVGIAFAWKEGAFEWER